MAGRYVILRQAEAPPTPGVPGAEANKKDWAIPVFVSVGAVLIIFISSAILWHIRRTRQKLRAENEPDVEMNVINRKWWQVDYLMRAAKEDAEAVAEQPYPVLNAPDTAYNSRFRSRFIKKAPVQPPLTAAPVPPPPPPPPAKPLPVIRRKLVPVREPPSPAPTTELPNLNGGIAQLEPPIETSRRVPPTTQTEALPPVPETLPGRYGYEDYSKHTLAAARKAWKLGGDVWFEFSLQNDYSGEAKQLLTEYILKLEAFEAAQDLNKRDNHNIESLLSTPQRGHFPMEKKRYIDTDGISETSSGRPPRKSDNRERHRDRDHDRDHNRGHNRERKKSSGFINNSMRHGVFHAMVEAFRPRSPSPPARRPSSSPPLHRRSPSPRSRRQSRASSFSSASEYNKGQTYAESMGRHRRGRR